MKTYVRIELESECNKKYKSIQALCTNNGDSLGIDYLTLPNKKYYKESRIVKCDLREVVILNIKKYFKSGEVVVEIIDPVKHEVSTEMLSGFISVDKSWNPHLISRINKFCGYELLKTY